MKSLRFRLTLLAGALLMLAFTSVASAQATRTWVSGVGDDANPCSRTAPCKTFAGAISKTAVNGEIDCLDPGGFGQVTITKAITIDCDSGAGGILVGAGTGVIINITPTAGTDFVFLRNLQINGAGTGTNGINAIQAKAIVLQDVTIERMSGAGLITGTGAKVTMIDSVIATIANQGVLQNGTGSTVFMTGSTVASTGTAFQSAAGNFIGVSGCTLANNGTVFNQAGGVIQTAGDNPAFGNGPTGPTTPGFTKI